MGKNLKSSSKQKITNKRSPNKKIILEFDVIRSLAIFALFLHHAGIYNFSILGYPLSSLIPYLEFFLLGSFTFMAGYLLIGSFYNTHETSLLSFWSSKITRIYIPYIVALLLLAIFFDIEATRLDLVIHSFGAQLILAPRIGVPIMTIWYVGLLMVYYFIFSIFLKFIKSTLGLLIISITLFITAHYISTHLGFIEYRFFYYYLVFLVGLLCAKTGCLRIFSSTRYYLIDKLMFLSIGIFGLSLFKDQPLFSINPLYIISITIYILSIFLCSFSVVQIFVKGKDKLVLFGYIAIASYFAFLFHRPIWNLLLLPFTFPSDFTWFAYIIMVGSVVVLSVSYYLQRTYNSLIRQYFYIASKVIQFFNPL